MIPGFSFLEAGGSHFSAPVIYLLKPLDDFEKPSMPDPALELTTQQLDQIKTKWLADQKDRLEARLKRLRKLKQGTLLLMLISSFLFFYLIFCLAEVIALW